MTQSAVADIRRATANAATPKKGERRWRSPFLLRLDSYIVSP
jgi:hypothetical protein